MENSKNNQWQQESLSFRKGKRFKVNGSALLFMQDGDVCPAIVRDVSPQGIGIVTGCNILQGTFVEMDIYSSFFEQRTHRKARVLWCNMMGDSCYRAGLLFQSGDLTR